MTDSGKSTKARRDTQELRDTARRQAAAEVLFMANVVRELKGPWLRVLNTTRNIEKERDNIRGFMVERLEAAPRSGGSPSPSSSTSWEDVMTADIKEVAVWKLADRCHDYLEANPPTKARELGRYLYRNLGVLTTTALAIYLACKADPIRSLLDASGSFVVVAIVIYVAFVLGLAFWSRNKDDSHESFLIALGTPPTRPFAVQPRPPRHRGSLQDAPALRKRLIYGLVFRLIVYSVIAWAPAIVVRAVNATDVSVCAWNPGRAEFCAAMILALLATPIALARFVDVWHFIFEFNVRLRFIAYFAAFSYYIWTGNDLVARVSLTGLVLIEVVLFLCSSVDRRSVDHGSDDRRAVRAATRVALALITSLSLLVLLWLYSTPFEHYLDSLSRVDLLVRMAVLVVVVAAVLGAYLWAEPGSRPLHQFTPLLFTLLPILIFFMTDVTNNIESWRAMSSSPAFVRISSRADDSSSEPPSEWPPEQSGVEPAIVMLASGGGSRAAIYAAMTFEALHGDGYGCALQAISSVSGGSLATAAYLTRRLDPATDPCANETSIELELVESVEHDFLFPALWGFISPFKSRGESAQSEFEIVTSLAGEPVSIADVAERWRRDAGRHRAFPIPLFNSSTSDGHAIVISPLEAKAFVDPEVRADQENNPDRYEDPEATQVYWRDAIYGLDDILPERDVTLAEAVRASANFPFGFPPVLVKATHAMPHAPHETEIMLTDGGVLSNSGMWSMFHLLNNNADTLSQRGVILIVVDASRMPANETPGLGGSVFNQAGLGQNLHRRMFQLLEQVYGGRLSIIQVALPAREDSNIETTWVLSEKRIAKLKQDFNEVWTEASAHLEADWNTLTSSPDATIEQAIVRPPLD